MKKKKETHSKFFVAVDLDSNICKTPPLEGLDFDGCRTPSIIYSLYTRIYVTLSEEYCKTSLYLKEKLDKNITDSLTC